MWKEIGIKNARIFEGKEFKFSLPDFTVFCGTNSSGKSTILKSILLLRQSIDAIRFAGPEVDLGNFSSFVSNNNTYRDLSIALVFEDKLEPAHYLQLTGEEEESEAKAQSDIPCLVKATFTFCVAAKVRNEQASLFSSSGDKEGLDTLTPQGILKSATYETIVENDILLTWEIRLMSESNREQSYDKYEILIPEKYFERVGGKEIMEYYKRTDENLVRVRALIKGILPTGLLAKPVEESAYSKVQTSRLQFFVLPPYFGEIVSEISRNLLSTEYLGPLRTPAQRYYITNFDAIPSLDPEGRFLPYILRHMDDYTVWNVRPLETEAINERLPKALNEWLFYLRTGDRPIKRASDEIDVSTLKDVIVEFQIKSVTGADFHALVDSGFGYSQVLPILVRGLICPRGHTLIIEQPELHLNPSLQVRVAEFLVAMVRSGKQIIIETHSEHIVNMIRVLTAEDEDEELAERCGIFFLDAESQLPIVHDLSIKPDGTVPKWPYNFFGEAVSLTGRMLRAQDRTRGLRKEKGA